MRLALHGKLWLRISAYAVLLASCAPPYGDDVQRVEGAVEAAARWAFQNVETELDPPAAYCLAVPELGEEEQPREPTADPSASLLGRLADVGVAVRPVSACDVLRATGDNFRAVARHSIVDRESGEFALLIAVGPLRWTGEVAAEIHVLGLQGGLWGTDWLCNVAWGQSEGWQVLGCSVAGHI